MIVKLINLFNSIIDNFCKNFSSINSLGPYSNSIDVVVVLVAAYALIDMSIESRVIAFYIASLASVALSPMFEIVSLVIHSEA